jgi:P-type Cu+ transporter
MNKGRSMKQEKQIINIEGLTCSACVRTVEKAVGSLEGIEKASVNFATEKLTVSFDPDRLSMDGIIQGINKAGYSASMPGEEEANREQELHRQLKNLIMALGFAIPLVFIAMAEMIGIPLPSVISPGTNPGSFALIQLILVLPILFSGAHFYGNGYPAL